MRPTTLLIQYVDCDRDEKCHQVYVLGFPDGRAYFGYTGQSLHERMKGHVQKSRKSGSRLSRAIIRCGYRFTCSRVGAFNDIESALSAEIEAISRSRSTDGRYGFNVTAGGESVVPGFGGNQWMDRKTADEIAEINRQKGRNGEANAFHGRTHSAHSLAMAVRSRRERGSYNKSIASHLHTEDNIAKNRAMWSGPIGADLRKLVSTGIKEAVAKRSGFASDAEMTAKIREIECECLYSGNEVARRLGLSKEIVLPRLSRRITQAERHKLKLEGTCQV